MKANSCNASPSGVVTRSSNDPLPVARGGAQPSTITKEKRKLPTLTIAELESYLKGEWTARQWAEHVWDRSNVKQSDIVCRLGLTSAASTLKTYRGVYKSEDNSDLAGLSTAIHELYKKYHDAQFDEIPEGPRGRSRGTQARNTVDPGRDAFIAAASDPMHMNEDLTELLFERFGSKLWGEDLVRREGCDYQLKLEDDEDRPKIEALIHLWVFVKIANSCRDKRSRHSKRAKEKEQQQQQQQQIATEHGAETDGKDPAEMRDQDDDADNDEAPRKRQSILADPSPKPTESSKRKRGAEADTVPTYVSEDHGSDDQVASSPKKRRVTHLSKPDNESRTVEQINNDTPADTTAAPGTHNPPAPTPTLSTQPDPEGASPNDDEPKVSPPPASSTPRTTHHHHHHNFEAQMRRIHGDLPQNMPYHQHVRK